MSRSFSVGAASLLSLVGFLSVIFVSGEVSSFEKAAAAAIIEYGKKIQEDSFITDPRFSQKLDRATSKTHYTIPNDREFEYVTTRNDTNQDVVVFTSEEDELVFKKHKRVYVVLKRDSTPRAEHAKNNKNHAEYYAAIAMIRDFGEKDSDPVEIDGGKYKIEWDIWDEHLIPGGTSLDLNSRFCADSIIVPCLFSDDPPKAGVNGIFKPPQRYIPKKTYFETTAEVTGDHFVVAGGDSEDIYDLYRDLESERNMQGRAVGGADSAQDGHPGASGAISADHKEQLCAALGASGGKSCGLRRRRSGEFSTALDFSGWKTQYIKAEKGSYATAHEENIFFGMGNCPAKPWKQSDLDALKDRDAVIDFYLTVLRTECVGLIKAQLLKLLDLGALKFKEEDKTFYLTKDYKKSSNPKLNWHESVLAITGTGFCLFTKVYQEVSQNPVEKPGTPDGKRITRSVDTMIDFLLRMLDVTRTEIRLHLVAATRHCIVGARMAFSKIAQDKQNLENMCEDCDDDLQINFNDRMAVMSLIQFLKYGLHDVDVKGQNTHDAYVDFYKNNAKIIEVKVNMYS